MGNISKVTRGSLAKSRKLNEVIQKVNAIENMTIRGATEDESPRLIVSDNNSELIVGAGAGGAAGGVNTEFILCSNGEPVSGKILFVPDE